MPKHLNVLSCLGMAVAVMMYGAATISKSDAKSRLRDFVVAGSDGYGTQDCLATSGDCGRIVADAWCESKGFRSSLAYRKLAPDELTGSTGGTVGKPVDSFLISCKD
ncbi:hypothetical protein MCEMSEM23_00829 [Rhabdaerophilaceae bacterium]